MKVEVVILGSPSPIVRTVSVDVKLHLARTQRPTVWYSFVKLGLELNDRQSGIRSLNLVNAERSPESY